MGRKNPLKPRQELTFKQMANKMRLNPTEKEVERWESFKKLTAELAKSPSMQSVALVRMARHFSEDALAVISQIMLDPEVSAADRLRAADMMLSRGYGRAQQVVTINNTTNSLSDQDLVNAVEAIRQQMTVRVQNEIVEAKFEEKAKQIQGIWEEEEKDEPDSEEDSDG
jgi:hypothetical protein